MGQLPPFTVRLQAAMAHAGVDVAELRKRMGVDYQLVRQAAMGISKSLSAENSAKAARVLGVDHYWLATGEGTMELPNRLSDMALDVARMFDAARVENRDRAYSLIVQMLVHGRWPRLEPTRSAHG